MRTKTPINTFIIYSHADTSSLEKLKIHLMPALKEFSVNFYYDKNISPGSKWRDEIVGSLSKADTIIVLVSANSMASEYYKYEIDYSLRKLKEGTVKVIPVYLRRCDEEGLVFKKLKRLQMVPSNQNPIAKLDDENEAFAEIAKGLRIVFKGIRTQKEVARPQKTKLKEKGTVSFNIVNPLKVEDSMELNVDAVPS